MMKMTMRGTALALCGIAWGTAVAAGQGYDERLRRLEDGVAVLDRASGDAPIQVAQADPSVAADFEVRLQRLERALSDLNGRYEETQHQLADLKDRLERVNGDVDFRLQQLEGGKGGGSPSAAAKPDRTEPSAARPGTPAPSAPNTPPAPSSPPASADKGVPVAALPSGANADQQYEYAFNLLRQADYEHAEKAFNDFLAKNKSNQLAGNAQYWLGETYYARHKYSEAAVAFAEGFQKYPKNSKAADNLLKLGMSLSQLNKKNDACTAFGQLLHRFPEAAATVKRRADMERKKLNCPG